MGETSRAAEGELESLLEMESSEDHCLVAVAVLWLHDGCCRELCLRHGHDVVRLAQRIIWISVRKLSQPNTMNQRRLRIIRLRLKQRLLQQLLLRQRLRLTRPKDRLLLRRRVNQLGDIHRLPRLRVQGHHGERAREEDVLGLAWFALGAGLCDFAGDFHAASAGGVGHLAAVLEVADLGEGVGEGDSVQGGGYCGDAGAGVFVYDDA